MNSYADELYGNEEPAVKAEIDEEDDISVALEKAISENKEQKKKPFRFQAIDSGAANCIFIKTTIPNPVELGVRIVRDLNQTKDQKTRHLLRLVPIEIVCKASLDDIVAAAGKIFDKHFLGGEGKTFSIIYNKRYNNSIKRDEIIDKLADLVTLKNCKNKVNLKNPEVSVIVEIIKGLCCLSVVEEYVKLKKYNLIEIANGGAPKEETADAVPKKEENIDDVPNEQGGEEKESNDEEGEA